MATVREYQADIDAIVGHRYDNGADHWATPDGRLHKSGPFSTIEAPLLLRELGVEPTEAGTQRYRELRANLDGDRTGHDLRRGDGRGPGARGRELRRDSRAGREAARS